MPLVSIITPSWNVEGMIAETINSVQIQTFTDWELLIADDCSTDRTPEIVADIGEQNVEGFGLKLREAFLKGMNGDDIAAIGQRRRQIPRAGLGSSERQKSRSIRQLSHSR